MPSVEIRDIIDNETGERIFPRTHVAAVIGLTDSSFFEEKEDPQDNTKKYIQLKEEYTGLASLGWMAAGGMGSGGGGGGGGLINGVYGESNLGSIYSPSGSEDLTKTFSAFAIDKIWQAVVALQQSTPNVSLVNGANYSTLTVNGTTADFYTKVQIDAIVGAVYRPAGNASSVSELGTLTATNIGKVYNMTAAFTTTADFLEGAGKSFPAGTNVVIVDAGSGTYKYDVLSGFVDLSGYALKTGSSGYNFEVGTLIMGKGTLKEDRYSGILPPAKPRPKWEYEFRDTSVFPPVTYSGSEWLAYISDIPTSLKNPNALTFGSKTYDGSLPKTITAGDLGALTQHQPIYELTVSAGTFTATSWNPAESDGSFNVPTTLDHLADGTNRKLSNYLPLTGGSVTGAMEFLGTLAGPVESGTKRYWWIYDDGSAVFDSVDAGSIFVRQLYIGQNLDEFIPSSYVTLAGAQTITGAKTFSGGIVMDGADIIPSTDLGSQIGYSNRRFSNVNARTLAVNEINFKNSGNNARTGYLSFADGYMILCAGANIDSSNKQIIFHETYGLYPENGNSINLGYYSSSDNRYRWANIYGVNADLSGNLSLASSSHIDIGPLRIEYDATNKALHITKASSSDTNNYGIYADGFVAAGGIGQTS